MVRYSSQRKRETALRRYLLFPAYDTTMCIAIGVPDEAKGKADRFDPDRIRKNSWQ